VRYEPGHRDKIEVDEAAMRDESAGRLDAFASPRGRSPTPSRYRSARSTSRSRR
jgi:hypothetical protein